MSTDAINKLRQWYADLKKTPEGRKRLREMREASPIPKSWCPQCGPLVTCSCKQGKKD